MSNIKRYNGSSWVNQPIDADTLGGKTLSEIQSMASSCPVFQYDGASYGRCYAIDSQNGGYSLQIGDSGFTVDEGNTGDGGDNLLEVSSDRFTYKGNSVMVLKQAGVYSGTVCFYARPSGNTFMTRIYDFFDKFRAYLVLPYQMPWFNLTYGTTNEWPSMCFLERTGDYTFMFRFFSNGLPMEYHDVDVRNQVVVFNSFIAYLIER